jgi:hypothetical protein
MDAEEFKVQKFNVQSLNGECPKPATLNFEGFLLDRQRVVVAPLTIIIQDRLHDRAD